MNSDLKFLLPAMFLTVFYTKVGYSQIQNDLLIEQIIESVAHQVSEDFDFSELSERLNLYKRIPLDINEANKEQLQELIFISAAQINSILRHREENGLFLDVLELQSIQSFDPQILRWLFNFIVVLPRSEIKSLTLKNLSLNSENELVLRLGQVLEKQSGYYLSESRSDPAYAGSPLRIFTRYRYNYLNKIFVSVNLEKDAGEALSFSKGAKGFDFYSANISYKGKGFIKKIIVGDYGLQFGEGLIMWSGAGFGKGANISTIAKQDIGLRPYSSVNEALFMRGFSATFKFNKILFTPFFSSRILDAGMSESNLEISTLRVSGLNRTKSEIEGKNAAFQRVFGANTQFTAKKLNAGITGSYTRFSKPFAVGKSLYQQYNFKGSVLGNIGINYSYTYKNSYFFGEAAHSINSGFANLHGIISSLAPKVSLALLYRNYHRNYHSFFNQALAESTNAVNEKGFYAGLTLKFNRQWDLFVFSDFFRFPWLKFGVDGPSSGYELFTQISYSPSKLFKLIGRLRQQIKEENSEDLVMGLDLVDKRDFRIDLQYKISADFSLRNRVELVRYHKGELNPEYGFLSFQDIIFDPMGSKFSGNIRFGLFETSGFNSRIYAYEHDVLYAYSVPAYQGKGSRFYINGRYTLKRGFDLWLRYAAINYANQETLGSGTELINGSKRSEIRLQLRLQF